jgi:hypothetical protein
MIALEIRQPLCFVRQGELKYVVILPLDSRGGRACEDLRQVVAPMAV